MGRFKQLSAPTVPVPITDLARVEAHCKSLWREETAFEIKARS